MRIPRKPRSADHERATRSGNDRDRHLQVVPDLNEAGPNLPVSGSVSAIDACDLTRNHLSALGLMGALSERVLSEITTRERTRLVSVR